MDEWMVDTLTSWKLFCFRLSQWPQRKWDRSCWEWRWVRSQNLKTLPTRSRVDSESASFAYRWCHRPAPRPLNPATSHNNNNSELPAYWCRRYWAHQSINWRAIFIFLLCSISSPTVCLLALHAPSLLLCFWWFSSATYRLEYELQHVESFTVDPFRRKYSWNDTEEDGGKKRWFWYMWTWPEAAGLMTSVAIY